MGKIIVTGTPGSGKTTVLSRIKVDAKIINLADEMLKFLAEKGVTDRDKVRHIPYSETVKIRKAVIGRLNKMHDDILIDTHASVKSRTRYIPGFSRSDLDILKEIKGIIYVDAHANDIMLRRIMDKARVRESDSEDEINQQRRVNTAIVGYLSSYLDVPLYLIMNRQNMLDQAVNEFERAVRDALGKGGDWVSK